MPLVTDAILELTLAGIITRYGDAYRKAQEKAVWQLIADEIPTTLPIQNYAWLGRGATMQQIEDEAFDQGANQKLYTLSDIEYKGYFAVDRKAIEDDQYGEIWKVVARSGGEPVRHWNQLSFQALCNGFANVGYDNVDFFSASHTEGTSGTQSNITSSVLSDAALQAAEAAMMALVDDKGIPLGIVPDTLVVGPAKARIGSDLLNSEVVVHNVGDGTASGGATAYTPFVNYWKGRYRIVVSPYLIGSFADYWFLLDTSREVKPVVMQSRSDVPITFETDMLDPKARMNGKFRMGPRGRYAAGYGLWQTAYGSNATS